MNIEPNATANTYETKDINDISPAEIALMDINGQELADVTEKIYEQLNRDLKDLQTTSTSSFLPPKLRRQNGRQMEGCCPRPKPRKKKSCRPKKRSCKPKRKKKSCRPKKRKCRPKRKKKSCPRKRKPKCPKRRKKNVCRRKKKKRTCGVKKRQKPKACKRKNRCSI